MSYELKGHSHCWANHLTAGPRISSLISLPQWLGSFWRQRNTKTFLSVFKIGMGLVTGILIRGAGCCGSRNKLCVLFCFLATSQGEHLWFIFAECELVNLSTKHDLSLNMPPMEGACYYRAGPVVCPKHQVVWVFKSGEDNWGQGRWTAKTKMGRNMKEWFLEGESEGIEEGGEKRDQRFERSQGIATILQSVYL